MYITVLKFSILVRSRKGYQIKEQEHFDRLVEITAESWWGSTTPAGIKRLQRRAKLIARKLSSFKNPQVLELGCGTGAFSKYLLKKVPLIRLTGCDISSKSIQIASNRYVNYKFANFEIGDATSLHYAANTFDVVTGNSILHHLSIERSLQECLRVLKPGGFIWFYEPNMLNPQIALEKNVRFIGKMLQNTEGETAFFRWSLSKKLLEIGFYNVYVQPFDFLHPIISEPLINVWDRVGQLVEKIPILREISGSLIIYAYKPSRDAKYYESY